MATATPHHAAIAEADELRAITAVPRTTEFIAGGYDAKPAKSVHLW
jgi:hypothetical protein